MRINCRAIVGVLVAMVAASMLAACGESPSQDAGAGQPTSNKPKPRADGDPLPQMTGAVSAGNSSSIISVHFVLNSTPVVNQALPVDIAIVPHREFVSVRAHFEAHDGLALTVGDNLEPVQPKRVDEVIKHQLVLLPNHDGVYMITATVETDGSDGTVTRVFSIPVIVAPAGASSAAPGAAAAADTPASRPAAK
jgi:hypothetical protein